MTFFGNAAAPLEWLLSGTSELEFRASRARRLLRNAEGSYELTSCDSSHIRHTKPRSKKVGTRRNALVHFIEQFY